MSHYTVAVMLEKGSIRDDLEKALAPYDENLHVQRYIYETKEGLVKKWRDYFTTGFGSDPNFKSDLKTKINDMTDDEVYAYFTEGITLMPDNLDPDDDDYYKDYLDEDGNITTTYNPNAKWDWWEIGGRWHDEFFLGDIEIVKTIPKDFSTYAFVDLDGKWHEPGKMDWFGMSSATDEQAKEFKDNYYDIFLKGHEDCVIVVVDCHI